MEMDEGHSGFVEAIMTDEPIFGSGFLQPQTYPALYCPICKAAIQTFKHLAPHLVRFHCGGELSEKLQITNICPGCKQNFGSAKALNIHLEAIHADGGLLDHVIESAIWHTMNPAKDYHYEGMALVKAFDQKDFRGKVDQWEWDFAASIISQFRRKGDWSFLTEKQQAIIHRIYKKVKP